MLIALLGAVLAWPLAARSADRVLVTRGWWGIEASYSMKWYDYRMPETGVRSVNWFGENGVMQGVKFGLSVQPVLAGDWGISSGAFMEIFSCVNRNQTKRIEDVGFYLPGHVLWQHRFSSWVRLHAETGPGFTWGILQKIIDPKDSMHRGYHVPFDEGSPRCFNCWWDVAAGVDIRMFRLSLEFSLGLTPSMRYLSVMGQGTEYLKAVPRKVAVSFGVVF